MEELIKEMPKVELHVHLEGTLTPKLLIELAKRNGMLKKLRYQSVCELQQAYQFFGNLDKFLERYYEGMKVLQTESDFYDLTMNYLQRAHQENVKHTEMFFDPQPHTERGVSFDAVVQGIHHASIDAEKQFGITSKLIMCFVRHLSVEHAQLTLHEALRHKDKIVAVGLNSTEVDHPPEHFLSVFEHAKEEGFLATVHAGEEGPPSYIWGALKLYAKRIDHGNRCIEDPSLVARLKDDELTLTMCPLSNVKLGVYQKLEDHVLKKLLESGVRVTVNSDDPAYFGGFITDNFIAVNRALGLSQQDLVHLSKNAVEASFVSRPRKDQLLFEIDQFWSKAPPI